MSDILLNLDMESCLSGSKKESTNKHQQFLRKRKFLERRGYLKKKQLPAKQNSGHQSHSWDQTKRRGHQDGSWTTFNRNKKQCNQTNFQNGLKQQEAPTPPSRVQSFQPGTLIVSVGTGTHQTRMASYMPNKAQASSKGELFRCHLSETKVQSKPAPVPHKVDPLSEFESGLSTFSATTKPSYKMVAIDCEMVGTGPKGRNSDLARCSVVSFYGDVLYDKYIRPESPITDYRSRWSGIRKEHMVGAVPFSCAQKEILKLLHGKIVVGHAIHNDFKALKYFHPKELTRDTSMIPLLNRKAGFQDTEAVSLKRFAKQLLHKDIQTGRFGHSSVEDAKTTMELYRVIEAEWERELATHPVSS
ncbi:interferon-stimulated 20 kDa exonuclease-like 2 [Pelobates fuscus]|uniref:interferon-stimulated 20 kDa exonuclease-like 2 n=1 Tax=Pelobates fuscus TaxID=191477 RepID=UPI002FE4FA20